MTDSLSTDRPNSLYSWYVVVVLMLCYALSFIDRQILSLLVEPIKSDLRLSDTEFSLLQGMTFAIFYTFVGLYMGKLADTKNRRNLIVIGVTAWSLMTALCGTAKNFSHLFMARVGVAIGEATLSPAAYSITGDYFTKDKLAASHAVRTAVESTKLDVMFTSISAADRAIF
jgi:MFS family permease